MIVIRLSVFCHEVAFVCLGFSRGGGCNDVPLNFLNKIRRFYLGFWIHDCVLHIIYPRNILVT